MSEQSSFTPPPSFEAALLELESIVAQLERGDLSLEDTLTLYARGRRLAEWCARQLDEAELKLHILADEES
ncbi:MAG: exodeoxyribonuclease VII small subunit [Thermoflexales bacterium]|nr:exodeoxyribonuclease VII small subunit [Thermoflexales bacterium]MCS7324318.1 exodeoxyribonuclease VII small subunit [Thermoflexales bacterium]MCX7938532.1 exodeoxyribonuclease VII small subunit [Thermoflexales bacterium]MDW8053318.1 exodeoxyribonuclease VII small subunit [Anaerolineae bacterium]MDW8291969.1 exodeoxyribonuclease VII small subunit [Anaerolineae bacterium]